MAAQSNPYNYSFQPFVSATSSYSYQLLVIRTHYYSLLYQLLRTVSAIRYFFQNSFVTNLYQELVLHTLLRFSSVTSEQGNNGDLLSGKSSWIYWFKEKTIKCASRNVTLVHIILRKILPRNDGLFKIIRN